MAATLPFHSKGHLTLGIEIEVQLLDPKTLDLKPVATELFARTAGNAKIKPEIFQSMAEINTGICRTVHDAKADLAPTIAELKAAAESIGALVATTGTHPFAKYSDRKLYAAERYAQLIDRNQWIARRLMIFGLHVHLGMRDGDTCIRLNNFLLHLLPHFLALSASSSYWQGEDTGLASCRATIFESCPTAGHPCHVTNWREFSELCTALIKSRAIASHKDLWWDIRPSPDFGTLEIRCCDGLATLSEMLSLVAFIHALAHWYEDHVDYHAEILGPYTWMMRENKWRAARYGLEADIIASGEADLVPLRDDIRAWLKRIEPQIERLGYAGYIQGLERTLTEGASHVRQRHVFARTGSLLEVARHNVREFSTNKAFYA